MGEPDDQLPATITRTIDLEGIGVTGQDELNEISRSSRGDVVYDPPKNDEVFASELKSIFGRIRNKAQELRVKFTKSGAEDSSVNSSLVNTPADCSRVDRDSLAFSQDRSKSTARDNEIEHEDPLKGLALDLSSEVSAEETLRKKTTDDQQSEAPANLDSTIIIGDIEEGNIFDNFNVKSPRDDEKKDDEDNKKELKINMEELQEVMNDVRIKHRAELDAVMLE